MSSVFRYIAFLVLIMTTFWSQAQTPGSRAQTPAERIIESRVSAVFIKVETESSTGAIITSSGSGFIISDDGYVLTAGHLIPAISAETNKLLKISGALGSRAAPQEDMELIARDPNFDFALLRFKNTAVKRIPVDLGDPWKTTLSSELYIMGFPMGTEFTLKKGLLVGTGGPRGSWITDTAINPGDSGGPVFNNKGEVVAMAASSLKDAEGIKFVLPLNFASNLLRFTGKDIFNSSYPPVTSASPPVTEIVPEKISYPIDQTRALFSGLTPTSDVYTLSFDAGAGKRIIRADLVRQSDSKLSDVSITINPDGDKVILSFRLTSGPVYDQYRGWLKGALVTQQVPRT